MPSSCGKEIVGGSRKYGRRKTKRSRKSIKRNKSKRRPLSRKNKRRTNKRRLRRGGAGAASTPPVPSEDMPEGENADVNSLPTMGGGKRRKSRGKKRSLRRGKRGGSVLLV